MEQSNPNDKDKLLYPRSRYYGEFKPEDLLFNANLQEFAHKVSYIAGLQTSGKLSPSEAYKDIESLWEKLKHSKQSLEITSESPADL
jgi:hypothetical protein